MAGHESRPDPDALLASIRKEESKAKQGKLKIFLGMCPGVGKTFTMLEAAHALRRKGVDVVVAVVETHQRRETEALLKGLEILPRIDLEYHGSIMPEMDVDAVLKRRPSVVLVDELAHTNVVGSRHPKRYQDVLELLEAGITVLTTVNIQHIESRVDVVRQITGVTIRETVPDSLIDRADEVVLVDLSPDQLRQRLEEGKVYMGARAAAAAENFFKSENLIALREIALRYTAEKVDQELRQFLQTRRIRPSWRAHERLLVAVGPSPYAESLLRWTRRQAGMLDCPWTALYVDTGKVWNEETKETITRYLGLARKLGAEVETINGVSIEEALLRFAREKGVTQIVLGKNDQPAWKRWFQPSFAEILIRESGDIDILVVRPEKDAKTVRPQQEQILSILPPAGEWFWALGIVVLVTVLGLWLNPFTGYLTISLLYLLAVVLAAFRLSRWPILALATVSAFAWDFLFIPPRFTFVISQTHDALMFVMMFIVALVTGHLTSKLREREALGRKREHRTATMLAFTQALSMNPEATEALRKAIKMIEDLFEAHVGVFQRDTAKTLKSTVALGSTFRPDDKEWGVAHWCYLNRQPAGKFTDTLSNARALYLPLYTHILNVGVMAVEPRSGRGFDLAERTLLENFAAQLAYALEKDHVVAAMQQAELSERSSHLQKTLLDSVSHELKTPLAGLRSATEMLERSSSAPQAPLVGEIRLATNRLQGVVDHLLDMTRLQTGSIQPQLEWCEVSEIFHDLVRHFTELYPARELQLQCALDKLVLIDPVLLEKAIWNLLHNAALYTPESALIELSATLEEGDLVIRVRDHGSGIPEEELPHIFKKFYRGSTVSTGGTGLGLSITRGFLEAMQGTIAVVNTDTGGALFTLRLRPETKAANLLDNLP